MQKRHRNTIEYMVYGQDALFSEPGMRAGGEKTSYHIPTYEAVKGITESIYWNPSIKWFISTVRVMNPIQTETKGIRVPGYGGGSDLAYYTYLKDVCYQIRAYMEINRNHPELEDDWNIEKHFNIARRMLKRGGRRDVFLGARECQASVRPCVFGEGESFYDRISGDIQFGFMYHGITYADEAVLPSEKNKMTVNFWNAVMKKGGILEFPAPDDCPSKRFIRNMELTRFGDRAAGGHGR